MPNRILKESICYSDNIDGLSWFEEVLFYRLMVNCDDFGRFDGRAAIIKNRLFPLKENLTLKAVSSAINALASNGLVSLYEFEGKPYLYLPTWNEHQNIRAKKSKYPSPDGCLHTSEIICNQMQADDSKCPRNPIQSNPNPNPNSNPNTNTNPTIERAMRFVPPTVEEVDLYCRERRNNVDPKLFVEHYTATSLLHGSDDPMVDWKTALLSYEKTGLIDRKR